MSEGRKRMEKALADAILAFAEAAERDRSGAPLPRQAVQFAAGPSLRLMAETAYRGLLEASEEDRMRAQRGDPLHRLLAHPFSRAFTKGDLSRLYLPNYFSFVHLVLGDDMAALAQRAVKIAESMRGPPGEPFDWDGFYEAPESEEVMWIVLARIAEAFRRFEVRRDWFVGLMQNNPHATSLSSNAFIPKAPGPADPPPPFGREQFMLMFRCLFDPMRDMTDRQRFRFETDFAHPPEQVFGALWEKLDEMG